jgi:hypothetical protein
MENYNYKNISNDAFDVKQDREERAKLVESIYCDANKKNILFRCCDKLNYTNIKRLSECDFVMEDEGVFCLYHDNGNEVSYLQKHFYTIINSAIMEYVDGVRSVKYRTK